MDRLTISQVQTPNVLSPISQNYSTLIGGGNHKSEFQKVASRNIFQPNFGSWTIM